MKKFLLLLSILLCGVFAYSQAPQAFKYQALVRGNSGDALTNQLVSFRIGIHDSTAIGPLLYQETHITTTNAFGLANLEIGNGTPITGTFSGIYWGISVKFMEIELDTAGGTTYTSMGTTQLLSVPYALYAENAGNVDDGDWTADGDTLFSAVDSSLTIREGNVGIGILNPEEKLHIDGNIKIEEMLTGTASDSIVTWDYSDRTLKKVPPANLSDNDWTLDGDTLYSAADSTITLKDGLVGINTTNPYFPLHVNGRGAFGDAVSNTNANRALNLISSDAVMRIWRYTNAPSLSPGVELIWGNQPGHGDLGNYWWDFYIDGSTGSLKFRDRSFGQGNSTRFTIDAGGNIGLGTSSPDERLHVAGFVKIDQLALGSASDSLVTWDHTDSTLKRIPPSSQTDSDWTIAGSDMYSGVAGNVGIGTTTPVTPFHVNGKGAFGDAVDAVKANRALNLISSDAVMRVWRVTDATSFSPGVELVWGTQPVQGDNGNFWWDFYLDGADGSFNIRDRSFGQGNLSRLKIDDGGNVGLGTLNPDEKLHVTGSVKIEDMLQGAASDSLVTWDPADSTLKVIANNSSLSDSDWVLDGNDLYSGPDSTVTIKNGNIGIGTIDPDGQLVIMNGPDTLFKIVEGQIRIPGNGPTQGIAFMGDEKIFAPGGNKAVNIRNGLFRPEPDGLSIATGNQERIRITSNGDIGIGTVGPLERLDVDGGIRIGYSALNNAGTIRWTGSLMEYNDGIQWLPLSGGGDPPLWAENGPAIHNINPGNVGIGIPDPQRPLHISDVLRLEPRVDPPLDPMEGDLYVNSIDHHIYCFLDGIWKQLD